MIGQYRIFSNLAGARRSGAARGFVLILAGLAMAGCVSRPVQEPPRANFVDEIFEGNAAPSEPQGLCWQQDIRPAVIETVTEQRLISPERRDAMGQPQQPAVYSSAQSQRIVSDRRMIWFQTPCPSTLTPAFIASLQRALKARGYYLLPISGAMDPPTREALRRYQQSVGLDSGHLAMATARDMGLIAVFPQPSQTQASLAP